MKTPRYVLARAIAEKTIHIRDEKNLAREIAAYLLLERRTGELESILRDIMQYRADHGVLEAAVVTAHGASDQVLSDIRHLLKSTHPTAKTVHVSQRLDSELVGGVRVDLANEQLDMSIKAKLATFKRALGGRV